MLEQPPSERDVLEAFVADNDDLLVLEEHIGRFNIFDALGIARREIRHSRFLAWLLDPSESHGHGDVFLKALLMDMLRRTPQQMRPLSPVDLDGVALSQVTVRREWPAKTDLCISCGSPPFVLAIENKVDASEHGDQLSRYAKAVDSQFPQVPALRIFLTRSAESPSDSNWVGYGYTDVYRVFNRVRRTAGGSLGGDVGVFLGHYLNLVGSQFMENPEIKALCLSIYARHRRAIDLINTYAPVPGSEALAPILDFLQHEPGRWLVRNQRLKRITFVPYLWIGRNIKQDGQPTTEASCDVYLECRCGGEDQVKVAARLVVGPPRDRIRRLRVIEQLTSTQFKLKMQRKKASNMYTRLASKTLANWSADASAPNQKIESEFLTWLLSLDPALARIPDLVLAQ